MKKTKKIIFLLTLIFTFNTGIFAYYYPMKSGLISKNFQTIKEEKNIEKNDPVSSKTSINVEKTADILLGYNRKVKVIESIAYIASETSGLRILNVSDSTSPTELGSYIDYDGRAYDVFISESLAYLAYGDEGLKVINISDSTSPTEIGNFDEDGSARSVYVMESYAYVACYDGGLKIINISDPTSPEKVGQFDDYIGYASDVFVSESYAYLIDHSFGLVVIDVSDPTSPEKVGIFNHYGFMYDVFVSGSYAYLAAHSNGLMIIDVSDPTSPFKVGHFDDGGYAHGVYVSGSYAYVADGFDVLEIIDISDPTSPQEVGQYFENNTHAWSVYVSGSYIYLGNSGISFQILHVTEVETAILNVTPENRTIWNADYPHYINWQCLGYIKKVNIELYKDGLYDKTIITDFLNYGSFHWTIRSSIDDSTNYQLKIIDANDSSVFNYSTNFEIFTNTITITTPNNSSSWEANSSHYIYWESTGYTSTVNIELYKDGVFETKIQTEGVNNGSYNWKLPADLNSSKNYQIKITNSTDNSIYGISENFEILALDKPSISGYNPILILTSIFGISVIIGSKRSNNTANKKKKNQ